MVPSWLEQNNIILRSNDEHTFSIATNIFQYIFLSIFVGFKEAVFLFKVLSFLTYYLASCAHIINNRTIAIIQASLMLSLVRLFMIAYFITNPAVIK